MPKRTLKQTREACPAALPDAPRGRPSDSAATRRERTVREILEAHGERGDPLKALARILATASDPKLALDAARALAPYLYPSMKAVEVSGPGGEQLVVEVRKV